MSKQAIAYIDEQMTRLLWDSTRSPAVTLDDLRAVVLRMDPHTMDAALKLGIEPEDVTPEQRHNAKVEAVRISYRRAGPL